MTYSEYILHQAETPVNKVSCLMICHDRTTNFYMLRGKWQGKEVSATSANFANLQRLIREYYGISIPMRKDLIFSRTADGLRFALLQGYLPGCAVIDMSDYKPAKKERS